MVVVTDAVSCTAARCSKVLKNANVVAAAAAVGWGEGQPQQQLARHTRLDTAAGTGGGLAGTLGVEEGRACKAAGSSWPEEQKEEESKEGGC